MTSAQLVRGESSLSGVGGSGPEAEVVTCGGQRRVVTFPWPAGHSGVGVVRRFHPARSGRCPPPRPGAGLPVARWVPPPRASLPSAAVVTGQLPPASGEGLGQAPPAPGALDPTVRSGQRWPRPSADCAHPAVSCGPLP